MTNDIHESQNHKYVNFPVDIVLIIKDLPPCYTKNLIKITINSTFEHKNKQVNKNKTKQNKNKRLTFQFLINMLKATPCFILLVSFLFSPLVM